MEVAPVSREKAAAAMRERGLAAPLPCHTPETIVQHADCFAFEDGDELCVFAIRRDGDVLWVDAAAALRGRHVADKGFALAREVAKRMGCRKVAFETARRGLVRVAEKAGFAVKGWVLAAEVEQ